MTPHQLAVKLDAHTLIAEAAAGKRVCIDTDVAREIVEELYRLDDLER